MPATAGAQVDRVREKGERREKERWNSWVSVREHLVVVVVAQVY